MKETYKELVASHVIHEERLEKCLFKYHKMMETETGRKFLMHLIRAFGLPSSKLQLITTCELPNGLIRCDLSGAKLIAYNNLVEYRDICERKISQFEKLENESDEAFNLRIDVYKEALKTTNPYAMNADLAYGCEKSDKIMSIEAINALKQVVEEIKSNPELCPELNAIVTPPKFNKPWKGVKKDQIPDSKDSEHSQVKKFEKHKDKIIVKQKSSTQNKEVKINKKKKSDSPLVANSTPTGGNTFADAFDFSALKAKFEE